MTEKLTLITEIESLETEIKRNNDRNKLLREQKKRVLKNLHEYMSSHSISKIGKYTIENTNPKRKTRKTAQQSREETLAVFRAKNVPNPEEVYELWKQVSRGKKKLDTNID